MPSLTVFDFDNPHVGIEFELTREIAVGCMFLGRSARQSRCPETGAFLSGRPRHSGPQDFCKTVQHIDLDENRPSVRIAAPCNDCRNGNGIEPPYIRAHPYARLQAHLLLRRHTGTDERATPAIFEPLHTTHRIPSQTSCAEMPQDLQCRLRTRNLTH